MGRASFTITASPSQSAPSQRYSSTAQSRIEKTFCIGSTGQLLWTHSNKIIPLHADTFPLHSPGTHLTLNSRNMRWNRPIGLSYGKSYKINHNGKPGSCFFPPKFTDLSCSFPLRTFLEQFCQQKNLRAMN